MGMSNIFMDMRALYKKYGFFDSPMTRQQLEFRINTLQQEEMDELKEALETNNAEEIVDALIDTIVIAAGTLELLNVNSDEAWSRVWSANMAKERGVKSTRPESGGFDLIKPEGWKGPDHGDNHGDLETILKA